MDWMDWIFFVAEVNGLDKMDFLAENFLCIGFRWFGFGLDGCLKILIHFISTPTISNTTHVHTT